MAGVGLSLAASGHASTASPQWLTRPAVFLHGVGVAFWVGALLPLACDVAPRRRRRCLPVLNRFSRVAVPVVGVLVLTGLVLAIIQLESFQRADRYQIRDHRCRSSWRWSPCCWALRRSTAFASRRRWRPIPENTRPLVRSILIECAVVAGNSGGGRRLALYAAAAGAGGGRSPAAGAPYPFRQSDVSGAGFAGHRRHRQFRAADRWPATAAR